MSIFVRRSKEPTNRPRVDGEALNAALLAYVHTFPSPDRLNAHLSSLGLLDHRAEIEARLKTALRSADDFLYSQVSGIQWNASFEVALASHVRQSSGWLSPEAADRLCSYGKWLAWHEGLSA